MDNNLQNLVEIPNDKGVHIRSGKYVYKYIRYFRNKEGKPRNQARCIGKLSDKSGMMIPNRNYFEIYKAATKYL